MADQYSYPNLTDHALKYFEFIQLKDITEKLFKLCGIYRSDTFYIKINHFPDYDLSSYDGFSGKDYIFKNSWAIPVEMESVIDFQFKEQKLYHAEDLRRMSRESGIGIGQNEESFLNQVAEYDPEILNNHGTEVYELNEFQLQEIRLAGINNEEREIRYEGAFFGDSSHIDPMDWAVYSQVRVQYVPNANLVPFYEALIGESYTLYHEDKNHLAFFILFSAFECFINMELEKLNPGEPEKEIRLEEKWEELFQTRFSAIEAHEIYESLRPKFSKIKDIRNDIAHGKKSILITDDFLDKSFLFVLINVLCYRHKLSSFNELKSLVKSQKADLS